MEKEIAVHSSIFAKKTLNGVTEGEWKWDQKIIDLQLKGISGTIHINPLHFANEKI